MERYVTFCYLRTARTDALNLPALQDQASLVSVLDEIVVTRLAVNGDQVSGRLFFLLIVHGFFLRRDRGACGLYGLSVVRHRNLYKNPALNAD